MCHGRNQCYASRSSFALGRGNEQAFYGRGYSILAIQLQDPLGGRPSRLIFSVFPQFLSFTICIFRSSIPAGFLSFSGFPCLRVLYGLRIYISIECSGLIVINLSETLGINQAISMAPTTNTGGKRYASLEY